MRLREAFRTLFLLPQGLLLVVKVATVTAARWLAALVAGCLLFSGGAVEAGWHYSSGYRQGYNYYQGGYYGSTHYYHPGYYYYEREYPGYLTFYAYPVYINTAFAQYVPSVAAPYQTSGAGAPVQQVQQSGVVSVTTAQLQQGAAVSVPAQARVVQAPAAVAAADPYAACHAKTQELDAAVRAIARDNEEMKRLLGALLKSQVQRQGAPTPMPPAGDEPPAKGMGYLAPDPADVKRFEETTLLLVGRCGDCHHATEAAKRKSTSVPNPLALFQGGKKDDKGKWGGDLQILRMSQSQLAAVAEVVASPRKTDQMPPHNKRDKYPGLTADEQRDVAWWTGELGKVFASQARQ